MTWDGTSRLFDTDGDGYADQSGIDSGGDGLNDIWQIDGDGDGLVDRMAFDTDGDGLDDAWTNEPEQLGLGDWSAGWALPVTASNGFIVGGDPLDDTGLAVDPFADIIALLESGPVGDPNDLNYQLSMGIVTDGLIGDAYAALHNAQAAASPGYLPSDNFTTDAAYRDYNGMFE